MHALFCTFFPVTAVQKLLKSVKIWQSCSQMYTATFYEPWQKCRFWYFQVRCAHKSDDVINFIIIACRISSRLKWYKNYKNWLRLAKVIVKNKMSRFYGSLCISFMASWNYGWKSCNLCIWPSNHIQESYDPLHKKVPAPILWEIPPFWGELLE